MYDPGEVPKDRRRPDGTFDGSVSKLDLAIHLAVRVFEGKTRDDRFTPAIIHSMETLSNLIRAGIRDEELAIAAILHDVLEDGPPILPESWDGIPTDAFIVQHFGRKVLSIVSEVTMPERLTYDQKTELLESLMRAGSLEAVVVKLADRLSNIRDMAPWPYDRRVRYARQTDRMVVALVERLQHRDPAIPENAPIYIAIFHLMSEMPGVGSLR